MPRRGSCRNQDGKNHTHVRGMLWRRASHVLRQDRVRARKCEPRRSAHTERNDGLGLMAGRSHLLAT